MKTRTALLPYRDKLVAGLRSMGFVERRISPQSRRHGEYVCMQRAGDEWGRFWITRAGGLRRGCTVRQSWRIGSPMNRTVLYNGIMEAAG